MVVVHVQEAEQAELEREARIHDEYISSVPAELQEVVERVLEKEFAYLRSQVGGVRHLRTVARDWQQQNTPTECMCLQRSTETFSQACGQRFKRSRRKSNAFTV